MMEGATLYLSEGNPYIFAICMQESISIGFLFRRYAGSDNMCLCDFDNIANFPSIEFFLLYIPLVMCLFPYTIINTGSI